MAKMEKKKKPDNIQVRYTGVYIFKLKMGAFYCR